MRYFIASLFLILSQVLFLSFNLKGQQRIKFKAFEVRSSGLQIKGDFFQLKDRLISPLAYTGTGGQVDIFRVKDGEMARNYFNLGFNVNYAQNKFGLNVLHIQPEFIFSHTRITNLAYSNKQKVLLGLAFSAKPRLYDFVDEDFYHVHWMTGYTLDLHGVFEQEIGRDRKLWFELQIPVAGVVFRPERETFYSIQVPTLWEITKRAHTNGYFASLHNMQSGTFRVFYDLAAGERGSLTIGYETDFISFAQPLRASVLTHSFALRIMINRLVL